MRRAIRHTAGMRNTATCAAEASAISAASVIFPRAATTTAPPCSAALPTIATITAATKNSDTPIFSAKTSMRADEDLGDERRDDGRDAQDERAPA